MKIFSPTISGSSQTSGSLTISGSLNVSQGITGSLLGTASWALNSVGGGSGVTQIVAGTNVTISPVGGTGIVTINSSGGGGTTFPYTGSAIISGSLIVTGSTNSSGGFTGSLLGTSSWATNALTSSFVNNLNQNLSITGAVILSGSSLPELRVIGDTQFTGSINSLNGYTGSLFGTSSWTTNARTASFLPVGTYSITSSWATNALTASLAPSYVLTSVTSSMLAPYTLNSQTSSFVRNNQTSSMTVLSSSFAATASFINNLNQNLSITGAVVLSGSSLPELRVIGDTQFTGSINSLNGYTGSLFGTASFATTSSYALNGGVTQITAGTGISINQSTGNVTITNTGGGGGATFPYTGSAIISGSLIVTGSTNSSGGFTGSLFGTASHAITASYALSSAGGGGSFSLAGATDVSFSALADGDLIRYNGIAGKWQNTNLGLTLTPSLSVIEGGYFGGYAKITNWGSYSQPIAQAFIKSGSSTIITCSVDTSGQITWSDSNTNYNFTRSLSVQVQDFGDIASEITTASYVKQTASFRYYRWFAVSASSHVLLSNFRFYSGSAQTSTAFPDNMTNSGSPAPYVASASSFYVGYPAWQAFDNSTATSWWNLSSPPYQGAFVSIDMGSTFTSSLRSMRIQFGQSFQDFTVANIQGSDDNTTWTTIHTITNVPSANNSSARNFG